jgi:hypothetical protein
MPQKYNQKQYLQALQWFFLQQNNVVSKEPVDDKDTLIDTDNNTVVDVNGNAILADPT